MLLSFIVILTKVVFVISGVQDEKKDAENYTLTYNGCHYYSLRFIKGFLTYLYNFRARKWYVFVEDVLDNDKDGFQELLLNTTTLITDLDN
ncbi:MAG TPA: hypothetical protein VNV85_08805 [Puia sp.]|jgi:hypothetical protein|nr:hypothetical protein [Puia sp.]